MSGEVPPLLPTVFISYASADRVAARALRDCLTAAGLEVWFDEEELGGGEAWDAKIRNQIRTCTYFMPVISATTETRREGYFRREWRFAVERTLDIADDVMFLLPVVIDDTRDTGARVPEKFFSVQWLRVPGGQPTPALRDLARKLATGEGEPAPLSAEPPPVIGSSRRSRRHGEPPPFPKFPAYPEHGNRPRFVYDLVIWFGHLLHSLWFHLPRWGRVIASAVILFNLIGWIFRDRQPAAPVSKKPKSEIVTDVGHAVAAVGTKLANKAGKGPDKASDAVETLISAAAEVAQSGRPVTLIPFSGDTEKDESMADDVFEHLSELLQQDDKPIWGVSPLPLKPDASDAEAIGRGQRMKSLFVLTAHAGVAAAGLPPGLTVRLFEVNKNELVWKETFALTAEPATVARRIADEVMKRLGQAATIENK
ncbi:MAG: toll/interleukin-1 receptor domain-containing protein [Lacunisphaera sp.]